MKKIGVILSILTVLTLSFITNNNVSAVSDVSVVLDNNNISSLSNTNFCGSDCSSYNYLLISDISDSVNDGSFFYTFQFSTTNQSYPRFNVSYNSVATPKTIVYELNSLSNFTLISNSTAGTFSLKFTFTEDNPGGGIIPEGTLDVVANGTYDVTNYASVDVQVEESSFIVQLFSQGFWGVATAIVTIIVPIIALFLIFRLVHDLLWGRG